MVTLPKTEGGLRIKKMAVQNDALLMKNLHKFFNNAEIPWVKLVWDNYYHTILGQRKRGSFWWRDIIKLLDQYKGIALPHPKNGKSIIFLEDMWSGMVLKQSNLDLYSFTTNKNVSLFTIKTWNNMQPILQTPLSLIAFEQFQTLEGEIQES